MKELKKKGSKEKGHQRQERKGKQEKNVITLLATIKNNRFSNSNHRQIHFQALEVNATLLRSTESQHHQR